MNVTECLNRFQQVRESGNGFVALCPAHEDNNASLSISEGKDGRVLVKCFAGCATKDVVGAVGLTMRDLMPSENGEPPLAGVKPYTYEDEVGRVLFQAVKTPMTTGNAKWSCRQPQKGGGWQWNLKGVRRVLYKLPQLLDTDPERIVFICEGEKDCETLIGQGQVATTNPGGASKWTKAYSDTLRGRHVVVLPDNDEPGRLHGEKVANALAGVATTVKVLELPDLAPAGDVSDWLEAGHTLDELLELERQADLWQITPSRPRPDDPATTPDHPRTTGDDPYTTTEHPGDVVPTTVERPLAPTDFAQELLSLQCKQGRTDVANGRRFAREYCEHVKYCGPWRKWIAWDGCRWELGDDRGRVGKLAKALTDSYYREGRDAKDSDVVMFAFHSASRPRVAACLEMAKSESELWIKPDQLDAKPWLLNVANGTLELDTRTFREHRREDFLTKMVPTEYDPDAECPRWLQFLSEVFNDNRDLVEFVQRAVGYSLTGQTVERCLFFLWGAGRNGKTTLVSTLQAMLGEYAAAITTDLLMMKTGSSHPTEICDFAGARMAIAAETERGRRLAESFVKHITGGEDRMKGRRMKENFWEFRSTHKLWISGNYKPQIRGTDDAIWDRIRLIPFDVRFDEPDKSLPETLEAELPGILAWAVRGCYDWQDNGLAEPDAVKVATSGYRSEMDAMATFLDQRCVFEPDLQVGATVLFNAYRAWCKDNNEHAGSQTEFGRRLGERDGLIKHMPTAGAMKKRVMWRGLGLVSDDVDDHTDWTLTADRRHVESGF